MDEFIPNQIWTVSVPFKFLGLPIGARMTVVKLSNGGVFIHSPVGLDDKIKTEIKNIGPVACVVSPSHMHHLFLAEYFQAYPFAKIYASPGLPEKRRDLKFNYILKDAPEEQWALDLAQMLFLGGESLREIVFYHRVSRTLIVADLIMNFREESLPFMTRFVFKKMGLLNGPTLPTDFNPSAQEKAQVRLSVKRILEWDFDKIILSHGELVPQDGKKVFQEAFSEFL